MKKKKTLNVWNGHFLHVAIIPTSYLMALEEDYNFFCCFWSLEEIKVQICFCFFWLYGYFIHRLSLHKANFFYFLRGRFYWMFCTSGFSEISSVSLNKNVFKLLIYSFCNKSLFSVHKNYVTEFKGSYMFFSEFNHSNYGLFGEPSLIKIPLNHRAGKKILKN